MDVRPDPLELGVSKSSISLWVRDLPKPPVNIHESADVQGAEKFWADHVNIDVGQLMKTSLKHHNPRTLRKNVGHDYRGCLSVRVLQSADLYRRIEGWWYGIVGRADQLD